MRLDIEGALETIADDTHCICTSCYHRNRCWWLNCCCRDHRITTTTRRLFDARHDLVTVIIVPTRPLVAFCCTLDSRLCIKQWILCQSVVPTSAVEIDAQRTCCDTGADDVLNCSGRRVHHMMPDVVQDIKCRSRRRHGARGVQEVLHTDCTCADNKRASVADR